MAFFRGYAWAAAAVGWLCDFAHLSGFLIIYFSSGTGSVGEKGEGVGTRKMGKGGGGGGRFSHVLYDMKYEYEYQYHGYEGGGW
jgi:hypothetical protein